MKYCDKNKKLSHLKYWNVNNLCGWQIIQKLPANDFKWVEDISRFNKDFKKIYNDESDEEYFLNVYVQYPENLHNLHNDLPFLDEKMKIGKLGKLVANLHDKT